MHQEAKEYPSFPLGNRLYIWLGLYSRGKTFHTPSEEKEDYSACSICISQFQSIIKNKKTAEELEGDDPGGRAFALILRPHPGAFRQLMCPHPGEFAHFFKKMLMPGG